MTDAHQAMTKAGLRNLWFSDGSGAFVVVDDDGLIRNAAAMLPSARGQLHVTNPNAPEGKYDFGEEWAAE